MYNTTASVAMNGVVHRPTANKPFREKSGMAITVVDTIAKSADPNFWNALVSSTITRGGSPGLFSALAAANSIVS
jgi:hypothetical protein